MHEWTMRDLKGQRGTIRGSKVDHTGPWSLLKILKLKIIRGQNGKNCYPQIFFQDLPTIVVYLRCQKLKKTCFQSKMNCNLPYWLKEDGFPPSLPPTPIVGNRVKG